jgi:hypothetical protein
MITNVVEERERFDVDHAEKFKLWGTLPPT